MIILWKQTNSQTGTHFYALQQWFINQKQTLTCTKDFNDEYLEYLVK